MAYDEGLAARIQAVWPDVPTQERKMFGGLAFMVQGHMAIGIVGDRLMVRLGDGTAAALSEPHTSPMDFTGRIIKSMLYVEPAGVATDDALQAWIERGIAFALQQPPK